MRAGTTLNSALGVGAPNVYKDFGSMYKPETKRRIREWEILVRAHARVPGCLRK